MTDNPRIAELRRRVEADPASIAFAQLAEEYRREGDFVQAIEVCRTGLAQYPSYLSARVTLGRALTETGRLDEARAELERVLQVAPDNVAAGRAMEELSLRARAAAGQPQASAAAAPPPAPTGAADASPRADGGRSADAESASLDPALPQLEAWLESILRDRAQRASRS